MHWGLYNGLQWFTFVYMSNHFDMFWHILTIPYNSIQFHTIPVIFQKRGTTNILVFHGFPWFSNVFDSIRFKSHTPLMMRRYAIGLRSQTQTFVCCRRFTRFESKQMQHFFEGRCFLFISIQACLKKNWQILKNPIESYRIHLNPLESIKPNRDSWCVPLYP